MIKVYYILGAAFVLAGLYSAWAVAAAPASRVNDWHTCPLFNPGPPPYPHVGGPILPPGDPTVLICGQPAARMGDLALCTGPVDMIAAGSPTVLIGGLPAARVGDPSAHGGVIVAGCETVIIGP